MIDAKDTLDAAFLEMRWRTLSLAADLDRIERAAGGRALLEKDARIDTLRRAIRALVEGTGSRAEHVQMIFSDVTPPVSRLK